MMIVGENRIRILVVLLLYAVVTGCASAGSGGNGKPYVEFHSNSAIEDRVIVARVFAPVADIEPGPNTVLVAAPFLGTSPLEIPEATKLSPMLQLARRVNTLSSVRHNGLSPKDLFSRSGGRVRGMRITRRLLYKNWNDVHADFPLVSRGQLRRYANESAAGIALAKWSVEYFFDVSPDRKAYRIILTGAHFIDHQKPSESRDEEDIVERAKPISDYGAFFGAVTYRYPNQERESLASMSIVYKLFQHGDQFVYTGGEQSSGWLPLQPANRGPYNLYISLVHASNFRSLIESAGGFEGFLRWLLGARKP